ncbi:ABC transporter substrate-binding protein [Streptomyces canus]|uniref:ABC transporter substrate-binding protein n=1 Tax=Streptomyces canus TaxID=58343 RepID=UPI00371B9668
MKWGAIPHRFHRGTAAVVAGGLVAVLAACSGNATEAQKPSPQRQGVATFGTATSASLSELKWALPYGEPNTIDPPNSAYYSSALVASNLCDSLLRLNPDYSVSPNLATAAQVDPKTVVFTLRDGVTFWNGDPLTAEDVVWSLDHALAPTSITSSLLTTVKNVEKTGPREVTVRFKTPDALFMQEMGHISGMIQQAKYAKAAGSKLGSAGGGLMCTGPYELRKWTPGTGIDLTANADYWNKDLRPRAKKVHLSFVTDSNSLSQALAGGQLDGAYEVPASTIPKLEKVSTGNLVFGSPTQLFLNVFAVQPDGAFSDPKVRKALWMTINNKALADVVYHGAAEPNYTALNVDSWRNGNTSQAAQKIWQAAYQKYKNERGDWGSPAAVSQAKKLLATTGYHGQKLVLGTLAGDATLSQLTQLIQAQAKQAGINVEIKPLQPLQYTNATVDPKARQGIDLMVSVSFNVASNPLELAGFNYLPGSYYNYVGYDNSKVTKAIVTARASLDPVVQAKEMTGAQSEFEQAYASTTLLQLKEVLFLKKGLGGAVSSFSYMGMPSLAAIGHSAG